MKARRRSGRLGPTRASIPSANAVSVDIAAPQPCAEGVAGVGGEVDGDWHHHAAEAGQHRAAPPAAARAARPCRTHGGLRARRRRRRTSSARCSPSRAGPATAGAADADRQLRVPQRVVAKTRRRSPRPAPPSVMASRTAALPVSVRRNMRSGVWRFRAHAVRPERRGWPAGYRSCRNCRRSRGISPPDPGGKARRRRAPLAGPGYRRICRTAAGGDPTRHVEGENAVRMMSWGRRAG